tara:strand:- start:3968 stop:4609 length:642 start_codon:yes stop_codon:yes gene_type:complete
MKVKIKNEGVKSEYNLIDSWSDVTLEKWIELNKIDKDNKGVEASSTIEALSNIPKEIIRKLDIKDVAGILSKIGELQNRQDTRLKNIIEVDGFEYGFHPDLDSITLGEYADLESFIKDDIEGNITDIMAILYRPIIKKNEKNYIIEPYDGNIRLRALEMLKMSAEQVQSALVFFYHLLKELVEIIPLFLINQTKETIMQSQQKVSLKSGDGLE